MGASDSKLVFKKGIFRLSEEKYIPADDPYWTSFWELPESSEDIFSLFSAADIRRVRETSLSNLETLVLVVTSRLFILKGHPSFPDLELAPERDALNCIRILTRILPYIYEAEELQPWEEKFFWGIRRKRSRKAAISAEVLFDESQVEDESKPVKTADEYEEVKPLAEELIDTLIDLLFFSDFTLPRPQNSKTKVSYAIWQSGVGCNTSIGTTKEFDNNRCEILRLLLTLTSKSMYMSANLLPVQGVKAITYIATCQDKQIVLSFLCSLLNTTLKYNPAAWRVPYNYKNPKEILVTYALQLLLVVLVYPIPETGPLQAQKNFYRHFIGRLHRPQDFQFILDGMTRILNQPMTANSSYLPGSQSSLACVPEMIMLFWETTQCNKRFRSFLIDTDRSHDFVIQILFYAMEYKCDASKQGIVRMCVFILQTLSVEKNFGTSLNKKFEGQESLPASVRVSGFNGTYADYLIHSIYTIITSSQGKLTAVYPALLAVINNIAAYIENLSLPACSKILQLLVSMSSPGFLFANESNHDLLQSLLESINAIIEHQYHKNPHFVFAILRNKRRFEALRNFTLESGQEELERRNRLKKDGTPMDSLEHISRTNSIDSIRSPSVSQRQPVLSGVPEESFAIGDDDEDKNDEASRAASVSSSVDDAVPLQVRGMSEKARGKMPAGKPSFSRQNSITSLGSYGAAPYQSDGSFQPTSQWIESWLPDLPLHTILTLIQELEKHLSHNGTSTITESYPTAGLLQSILKAPISGIDPSRIRIHSFEWCPLSLGWYESLLWGFVFTSEMQLQKGTVGVWNGTSIRLFRVQEMAATGPSLTSPRGAVDAVGSNLVSRIGNINLRGVQNSLSGAGGGNGNGNGNGAVGGGATRPTVRTT